MAGRGFAHPMPLSMNGARRRWVRRRGALLRPLAGGLALLLALAAPAGAARVTFVAMFSDPGDYIGGGQPRFFHPGNASITISGDAEYFIISLSGGSRGDDWFWMDFAAPPGEALRPGLYTGVQRAPFRQAGHAGMDIVGDGRGCNEVGGRFDVKDFHIGPDGTPDRVWISYEQHCENGPSALFGEIRLGEPADPGALLVVPGTIWWPDVQMKGAGTTVPITLINAGAGAVSIAAVALAGLHAKDFPVRADECTGAALPPGAACEVLLRFVPTGPGPHVARLRAMDGTGQTYGAALDGYGIPGVTKLVMQSDPGDWVGQGLAYRYTPRTAQIFAWGDRSVVHGKVTGQNGDWWYLDFAAPPGDILAVGTYRNAARYPFNGTSPGMAVSGNGRGCNTLTGEFRVTALEVGPADAVGVFGVKFVQHCEGMVPALHGTFKFQVPRGDTTPPGPVSGLAVARSQDWADVSWTNPADLDYAFTLVRFLSGTVPPGAPDSGLLAYAGSGTAVRIPGVPAGQSLAVAVYTVDTRGNVGPPVVSVTP